MADRGFSISRVAPCQCRMSHGQYNERSGPADIYAGARNGAAARCARRAQTLTVTFECAARRVLAEDVAADRDTPALARSVRDGFAVRAADLPGRAGGHRRGARRRALRGRGRAGAGGRDHDGRAAPGGRGRGRDGGAHARESTGASRSTGAAEPGQFINPRGCEAAAGEVILRAGTRLDYSGVALLAAVGRTDVRGLPAAHGRDRRHRRRDRRAAREPRRIPDSQLQRMVAGRAGGARRRHSADPAGRARHAGTHARDRSSRGWRPTCCCFRAASRRGSTMWWSRCWRSSARSSSSTAS